MMRKMIYRSGAALLAAAALLGGCSTAVKTTPGLEAMAAGNDQQAYELLREENLAGVPGSKYGLGVMTMEGRGVPKDELTGESFLIEAALAGDPRAVSYLAKYYSDTALCEKDRRLAYDWRMIGIMKRNLVSGVVETSMADSYTQARMAEIYASPCEGRPSRPDAAQVLATWARMPKPTYVYVP